MHTPKIVYENETATEIHAETVPNEDPVQSVDNEPINDYSEFNFIMNSDILMSLLLLLCCCPDCDSD